MFVFLGMAINMLLGFASKIIIVRYLSREDYGLYSLGFTIASVCMIISLLGLQAGSSRQIAFYKGGGYNSKAKGVVYGSLLIALISSISLSLILFLSTDFISATLFKSFDLSIILKIFIISIPFLVLTQIIVQIYRGFGYFMPNFLFLDILYSALFPILLLVVIAVNYALNGVVAAYSASAIITFTAIVIYALKRPPQDLKVEHGIPSNILWKETLSFSAPLFAITIFYQINTWSDNLMLGYFMKPSDVGLYNAALPIVYLLPMFLEAIRFFYVPVMSELYAQDKIEEIRRSFAVISKWLFAFTTPVFLVMMFFPDTVLNILFGAGYDDASVALQILAAGFFIHTILGPNGATLVILGKTQFAMWATLIGAIANVILNYFMIPALGINGAAIATLAALVLRNLLISGRLYQRYKMQPFTIDYLKPAIMAGIVFTVIYFFVTTVLTPVPPWLLPIFFVVFLALYGGAVLLTKSFSKEDIMILLAIEKRVGIDLTVAKKILRRFL